MREVDKERGDGQSSRLFHVLNAAYQTALMPGLKGSVDRKLLVEQCAGKARQQVEMNANVSGLRVLAILPDNGRGPDDPDPSDDDASSSGT